MEDLPVPFYEQIIHLMPMAECIILIITCLQISIAASKERQSSEEIYSGFWTIIPVVLSFLSVILGLGTLGLLCNIRRHETKQSLIYRIINEILMVGTCMIVFYLMSLYHTPESLKFFVIYVLSNAVYGLTTLFNFAVILLRVKRYQNDLL